MPIVDVGYGHYWLDLRFADLRDAILLAENLMSQHRAEFETMVKTSDLSDWQREDLYSEWLQLKEQFPQVLRRALFVVSYARIEALLNDLCHAAKKQDSLSLALGDLNGMGITRAKLYLTKIANLHTPFQSADWKLLKGCNHLRNCLVHGNGHPTPGDRNYDKLSSFIEEHALLRLDQYGYIVIEPGFCEKVVDAAHQFFEQFPLGLIVEAWRYGAKLRVKQKQELIQGEVL